MCMDGQTKGQTNGQNYTKSLSSLNSIGQTIFELESGNEKCGQTDTDVGHINLIGGLVTCNPPKIHKKI